MSRSFVRRDESICPKCGYPMYLHTLHTRVTDYRGALVPLDDVMKYDLGETICPTPRKPDSQHEPV